MIAERAAKKGFARDAKLWMPKKFPASQEWFDADYFDESRRKSAYSYENNWGNMRKHYIELAHMAVTGFPFSGSFLDAGCGRGLLLRALFELTMRNDIGFDAEGFDFSEYAVKTADPLAKPFIKLDSFSEYSFLRTFDVLLMMNVLEYLADEQIEAWLKLAKDHIATATLAIIGRNDKNVTTDYGAFNVKPMKEWNAIFNDNGWMQDQEAKDMQNLANLITHVRNSKCDAFYFKPRRKDVAD